MLKLGLVSSFFTVSAFFNVCSNFDLKLYLLIQVLRSLKKLYLKEFPDDSPLFVLLVLVRLSLSEDEVDDEDRFLDLEYLSLDGE